MNSDKRVKAFQLLGDFLKNLNEQEFNDLTDRIRNENAWFTRESVSRAIEGMIKFLKEENLQEWIDQYTPVSKPKNIALVMAGNIPFVGFHDLLAILVSGHQAQVRLSSKDKILPQFIIDKLTAIEPEFINRITIVEQLKGFDAVIATGSDNSARYFDYYFGKYPNIIRRNRTSVGILDGSETKEELEALGTDIFSYYGLGCRNISKIFIPKGFNINPMFEAWEVFQPIIHHHKYNNNYDYQKSLLLINSVQHLDNGFIMLRQSEGLVSPISVLFYDYYRDENDLQEKISPVREKIQVIAGKTSLATINFGEAQYPGLCDYPDNVDTMKFLTELV